MNLILTLAGSDDLVQLCEDLCKNAEGAGKTALDKLLDTAPFCSVPMLFGAVYYY